jgi:hypothetical protein
MVEVKIMFLQITVEESKEADTTTKQATHRISRGIHDKVDNPSLCSEPYLFNRNYIE